MIHDLSYLNVVVYIQLYYKMKNSVFDDVDYQKDCEMYAKYKDLTLSEFKNEKIYSGTLHVKSPKLIDGLKSKFYLLPYVLISVQADQI